ncbi:MAG: pitrilysin family protein [candidate division Zixibacteria bacterium]|nr:pitrilysin family protein [candidate division Zixibacteria bacterium]
MKGLSILLLGFLLILTTVSLAQTGQIQLDVKKKTLSNGMRILVLENHAAPTFSAIIRFNTGSVDEHPGITGSSHLLEHMLFKGTKIIGTTNYEAEVPIMAKIDSLAHLLRAEQVKLLSPLNPQDSGRLKELKQEMANLQATEKKYVVKDELWDTYLKEGGTSLNASTSNDGTQYYVSLPRNCLELWAFFESDRLANLVLREFYSERDVVMEERRLTTENSPRRSLDEALSATVFWASPYCWSVVGWMSDLQTVMREDVEAYFRSHYSPANAVAVIVGDVDANQLFKICDKYFSKIPSQPAPPPVVTRDAPQKGERRTEIEYDANPMVYVGWPIPQIGHPDLPALEVAANILSDGRTSRFYKNIREKKLGSASASSDETRLPSAFTCTMTPFGQHTTAELEEAVYAEIDRLKTEKVSEWELEKVRNQKDASFIRSLESNRGLAFRISSSEAMTGDWRNFLDYREALKKVTADDIIRVVDKYLTKKNRSVAYIVKSTSNSPAKRAEKEIGR